MGRVELFLLKKLRYQVFLFHPGHVFLLLIKWRFFSSAFDNDPRPNQIEKTTSTLNPARLGSQALPKNKLDFCLLDDVRAFEINENRCLLIGLSEYRQGQKFHMCVFLSLSPSALKPGRSGIILEASSN